MNLSKHSWLYRYAYCLTSRGDKPGYGCWSDPTTDLCRFFWRCVLLQPLKFLVCGGLISMFVFSTIILPAQRLGWWGALMLPAIIVTAAGVVWLSGIVWAIVTRWLDTPATPRSSIFVEYYRAVKGKYCPIITITKE